MTLKWDYDKRTCNISMPGYVTNVLSKFNNDAPKHPQYTPSRYVTPVYGSKTQYTTKDLYYTRAVDPTVVMPLNDIDTEQTKATEKTHAATNQMLDYLPTHPDATIG
jgi:hypothetical protein